MKFQKINLLFKGIKSGNHFFGESLNQIVITLLLSITYLIGVGITSIIAKTMGHSFLDLEINDSRKSYWVNSENSQSMEEYGRQF